MIQERRSQAERRAETQAAILKSATRLFGEKGYSDTSLEDIAADCGLSIAPIYHYFSNKKNLFQVVCDAMEDRIMNIGDSPSEADRLINSWKNFLRLCADPEFRRIVLVDAPVVLGRERIYSSRVSEWSRQRMKQRFNADEAPNYKAELVGRMLMAALAEAGLFVGNTEHPEQAANDAEEVVSNLIQMLAKMKTA